MSRVSVQSVALVMFLLALQAGCGASDSRLNTTEETSAAVDALFAHLDAGKQPGAAVMVIKDAEIVYRRGFGYADLEAGRRIDADSAFRLASVSKAFTAAAVQVLAEKQKLDIDDLLVAYLPEQASYPDVTIRHLLTHTSGMPDYYDVVDAGGKLLSNADVALQLAAREGPDFAPGDKHAYSNSAYELLALIVEAASGQRFADFLREHIFEPAGMRSAVVHDHSSPDISGRVYGYDKVDDGFTRNDEHFLNGIIGSGGVYASLNDLYAWDQALYGGRVVTQGSLRDAWTPATLNDGSRIDYGFGWRIDCFHGHRRIGHGGSWVGFRTAIARFPDERLSIVVLTNGSWFEPERYVDQIAAIYLLEN